MLRPAAEPGTGSWTTAGMFNISRNVGTNNFAFGTDTSERGWMQNWNNGSASSILINPLGGNVGIGTDNPSSFLQVGQNVTNGDNWRFDKDGHYLAQYWGNQTAARWKLQSKGYNYDHTSLDFVGGGQLFTNSTTNIGLAFNGTPRLTVISGGNVGIGTATPQSKLDVAGGARVGADAVCSAAKAGMLAWNSNTLQVCTDAGGFVEIATSAGTAPSSPDALDFTEFKDAMTLDASTDIAVTGTDVLSITNTGTGNSLVVNDEAGDTTPFVIGATGNVGVGTTTPTVELHAASTGTTDIRLQRTDASSGATGVLAFGGTTTGTTWAQGPQVRAYGQDLFFDTDPTFNATDESTARMTILGTGNVGIGTTTPAAKFHVVDDGSGTHTILDRASDTAQADISFRRARASTTVVQSGDDMGRLLAWGYDGSVYRTGAQIDFGVDATPGASDMPGRIVFSTTPDGSASLAERMRIDSAGNVGIGTDGTAGTHGFMFSPSTKSLVLGTSNAPNGTYVIAGASTGGAAPVNLTIRPGNYEGTAPQPSATLNLYGGSRTNAGDTNSIGGAVNIQGGSASLGYGNVVLQAAGGNVGIGTASPAANLDVAGATEPAIRIRATGASSNANLRFVSRLGGADQNASIYTDNNGNFVLTPANGQLAVNTINGGGATMTVGGSLAVGAAYNTAYPPSNSLVVEGSIGIGTTSPQSRLHVAGGIQLGGDTDTCPGAGDAKVGTIRFASDTLELCKTTGWDVASGGLTGAAGLDKQVQFNDAGALAGASQLIWDKGANRLGIGATTDPTQALDVTGTVTSHSMLLKVTATAAAPISGSSYWASDGTNVWRATGNVGIGTTAPGATLDVNGGVRVSGDIICLLAESSGCLSGRMMA